MKLILVNIVSGFILSWNEKELLSLNIMTPLCIKLIGVKLDKMLIPDFPLCFSICFVIIDSSFMIH